ncbi:MAG: protein kinase domain-containing protein [Gaiellaceae bacterium]
MTGGELIDGRYELEELVGTGGMSTVYRARDTLLERNVALKVMHAHHLEDDDYVERFQREARTVAQLSHPNIVTVIDRGEDNGRPFIVFEYVEGDTLDKLVERDGALPVEEALRIAIGAARGLAFAHRQGHVHRDVKPQNILLNGGGQPKVTDFGISRALDVHKGVTQTGTVLGTSNYIAPEQASGDKATAQSDVYSLGVVLFELLTGRRPFSGDNFVAVAMKHINERPPSVTELRRDVPPRVAAAVACALEKDPRDRFASMEAFAAELDACLHELRAADTDSTATVIRPPAPRAQGRAPRRRISPTPLIVALLALAALAVIAVAAIAVNRDRSSGTTTTTTTTGNGSGGAVALTGASGYDPQGDGTEHDSDAPNATDGNPATYWTTEHYGDPDFGGLAKDGVGLVLNAPRSVALKKLTVTTDTPGFSAVVKAGDSAGSAQTDSSAQTVNGTTTFELNGRTGSVYLLWITRLASDGAAHVNGVTATS